MSIISIYSITNQVNDKRYIGKSVNTAARWSCHRHLMKRKVLNKKAINRHLWNDAQRFGVEAFSFEVLQGFDRLDAAILAERELYWMDHFNTCDRDYGYNLRRDSSSMSFVHAETREIHRRISLGHSNPNFGNKWSVDQKEAMRLSRLARAGRYQTEEYRRKQSEHSKRRWEDKDALREMSEKVRKSLLQFNFVQMDEDFNVIRIWSDMRTLVHTTGFAKQCVYAVCDGYKQRYRGFRWAKVRREVIDQLLVLAP